MTTDDLYGELLELAFDCHPDPEALRARIVRDPEVRDLWERARGEADLLREAARLELGGASFEPEEAQDERPTGVKKALLSLAVLAAAVLVAPLVHWTWWNSVADSGRRIHVVSAPFGPDHKPLQITVETTDLANRNAASVVDWTVTGRRGQELQRGQAVVDTTGTITIPALDAINANASRARIDLTATPPGGGRATGGKLAIAIPDPPPVAALRTDRPLYAPGESVRARVVLLDRISLQPLAKTQCTLRVVSGLDLERHRQSVVTDEDGVAEFEWPVPDEIASQRFDLVATHQQMDAQADGGLRILHTQDIGQLPFEVRRVAIPTHDIQVTLDRSSYRAGDVGQARVTVRRLGNDAGPASGVDVLGTIQVDGQELWRGEARTGADGACGFQFAVSSAIAATDPDGLFVARVTDGGVVASGRRPFALPTGPLDIEFVPESGTLVAGTPNRVYLQARDRAGRPFDITGSVVDEEGTELATFATQVDGRGVFEFTPPKAGGKLLARIDRAGEEPRPLPRVEGDGVLLRAIPSEKGDRTIRAQLARGPEGRPHDIAVVALCRGVVVGTRTLNLAPSARVDVTIPVPEAAAGVLRIAVVDAANSQPLGSRLIRRTPMPVSIRTEVVQESDGQRTVQLQTSGHDGRPVRAVLAVSVLDAGLRVRAGLPDLGVTDQTSLFADIERPQELEVEPLVGEDADRAIDLWLGTRAWRREAFRGKTDAAGGNPARHRVTERSITRRLAWWNPNTVMYVASRGLERTSAIAGLALVWLALAAGLILPLLALRLRGPIKLVSASLTASALILVGGLAWLISIGGIGALSDSSPVAAGIIDELVEFEEVIEEEAPPEELAELVVFDSFTNGFTATRFFRGVDELRTLPDSIDVRLPDSVWRAGLDDETQTEREPTSAFARMWSKVRTDEHGTARVTVPLPSSRAASYEVLVDAHTSTGALGQSESTFTVERELDLTAPEWPTYLIAGDELELDFAISSLRGAAVADLRTVVRGHGRLLIRSPRSEAPDRGVQRVALETTPGTNTGSTRGRGSASIQAAGELLDPTRMQVRARATTPHGSEAATVGGTFAVLPAGFPQSVDRDGLLTAQSPDSTHTFSCPDDALAVGLGLRAFPSPVSRARRALAGVLREPHGCFEQTSATHYPNVLTLTALEGDEVDSERAAVIARARTLVAAGAARLRTFECEGGGFDWFGRSPANVSLTAYGLIEFVDTAAVYPEMDEGGLIARTRDWLHRKLRSDGTFAANSSRARSSGPQAELRSTYSTWALLVAGTDPATIGRALDRCAERARSAESPYEVAIATIALASTEDRAVDARRGAERLRGWQAPSGEIGKASAATIVGSYGRSQTVETTALAVLAWHRAQRALPAGSEPAFAIELRRGLRWLGNQQSGTGEFGSTQATVLALRALLEATSTPGSDDEVAQLRVLIDGREVATRRIAATMPDAVDVDLSEYVTRGQTTTLAVELVGARGALAGTAALPFVATMAYRTAKPVDAPNAPLDFAVRMPRNARLGDAVPIDVQLRQRAGTTGGRPLDTMAIARIGVPAGLEIDAPTLSRLVEQGRVAHWERFAGDLVLYWRSMPQRGEVRTLQILARAARAGTFRARASRANPYYEPEAKTWVEGRTLRIER